MHSKAAKDQLVSEIGRLRTENKELAQRHIALGEKSDLLESVVRALQNDDQSHEVLHLLKRGENLRTIADRLGRPLIADLRNISPESERQLNAAIDQYRQQWVESQDPCFWSNVTSNPVLLEYLVTLYLTWIHPLHVLFDEEEFMSSFRKCEDVYCSPSLVNAICAMACHVLRSELHADDGAHSGIDYLQSRFMDEVEQLQRDVETPKNVPIARAGALSKSPQEHSQSNRDAIRPDHGLKSAYEQAKLYRIVHEILLSYCGSRGKVSGSHMILIYERLLNWKRELPRDPSDAGPEAIQTLQPMLHTENTDKKSEEYLTQIIVQHAHTAFNLLVQYCDIYTFCHQTPIQLFCTVHVCDALLRYNPNDAAISEVIMFALQSLEEASIGYPIAKILRDSFRQAVFERHLTLPAKVGEQLDQKSPYLPHDIQNAFTRSTYQQPTTQILPALDLSLGKDFAALLEKRQESDGNEMETDGEDKLDAMQIRAVLNHEDSPTPSQKNRIPPSAPAPATSSSRRRAPRPVLIGGVLVGAFAYYGFYVYKSSIVSVDVDPLGTDVSYRYNATASTFDNDVDFTERYTGITKLRKELVRQARGNVLEAAVGTGRNSEFYESDRIKSLTLLDQSQEMIEVAKAKWKDTHPEEEHCRLITQSALDPLPTVPGSSTMQEDGGYDTIIATMSLCSTPLPSLFLRNLATGLSHRPTSPVDTSDEFLDSDDSLPGRILLLEHGSSYFSFINKLLDRTAPAHALKHGCWWNRDIGQIAEDSGLEVINIRRKHFGTTWWLELRLPDVAKGKHRQEWLENTRREIMTRQAELLQTQGEVEKQLKERDQTRRKEAELEKWRREQRHQWKK
ncbi:MAG: hypothetical protein Q9170_002002 [Blastenia crenularia]